MVRKEKTHLSKFRTRVKELEAQGNETEALLSGIKEDKVQPRCHTLSSLSDDSVYGTCIVVGHGSIADQWRNKIVSSVAH